MSIRAAKVLAQRALVESIHGLKLRSSESVQDMVAASFIDSTESKTSAQIKGINFDEVIYDAKQDIAQVKASVCLDSITNIDGKVVNLNNKVFRRVAFATSTPSQAPPLKALRASELDAYKQLMKKLLGFTLESQTTVENFILRSDVVKTKVMATIFLAEVVEYGWDENGDAFTKMKLNIKEASEMLGEEIVNAEEVVEVVGQGAQENDFQNAQKG